ncbi:cell division protein SepF [Candidatus Woesearchaeota archaeon]|nr:cell division protein SepF [Candidatus Woesearchaeota archaeon]
MKKFLMKVKDRVKSWGFDDEASEEFEEEYLELDTNVKKTGSSKILVRPYVLEDFSDVKSVLDSLRDGYTVSLVNIRPLKDKDLVELKRAINKLKKTCDAIGGDIAGFGDDYIVVTPSFAEIYRNKELDNPELKE